MSDTSGSSALLLDRSVHTSRSLDDEWLPVMAHFFVTELALWASKLIASTEMLMMSCPDCGGVRCRRGRPRAPLVGRGWTAAGGGTQHGGLTEGIEHFPFGGVGVDRSW